MTRSTVGNALEALPAESSTLIIEKDVLLFGGSARHLGHRPASVVGRTPLAGDQTEPVRTSHLRKTTVVAHEQSQ
jgi:hypothetical protein